MKPTLPSILTRAAVLAILAAVMFASTGYAHAATMNAGEHKFKTGKLQVTAPVEVGGALLEPGSYEVKIRNSGGASLVEIARWNYNPYAQEGLSVWDREVVATVNALPQTTNSAATRTGLLLAANSSKAIGLQVRGATVDYVF